MSENEENRVLRAIEALDSRLRNFQEQIATQFANLPQLFMPRSQLQDRFEAINEKHADLVAAVRETNTRIDAGETKHTASVRFVVTTALAALGIAVAALTVLVVYVNH